MSDTATVLIQIAWKLPLAIIALSVGEWVIHKYILHGKWIYKNVPWMAFSYRGHHIQHHGNDEMKIRPHIDLTPIDYFLMYPFIIAAGVRFFYFGHLFGLSSLIVLLLACFGHMILWNKLHRAMHGLEPNNWTTRLPFYEAFAKHHLDHHIKTTSNYGVVCIWIDRVFRTKFVSVWPLNYMENKEAERNETRALPNLEDR